MAPLPATDVTGDGVTLRQIDVPARAPGDTSSDRRIGDQRIAPEAGGDAARDPRWTPLPCTRVGKRMVC